MTLALSLSDNLNNTGMTATIVGSDASSNNSIYVSPLFQGRSPLSWSLAGSRIGDGTLNLPVAAAYYFAYCAASSVGGAAALSPPVIGLASIALLSMQDQVEQAIQAKIQALSLNAVEGPLGSIPASRVYYYDTAMTDEFLDLLQTPCVVVTPGYGVPETITGVVNARDDVGWPVDVWVIAQFQPRQQNFAPNVKRWREQILRALRFQPLLNVPEVQTVLPEPQAILMWRPPQYGYAWSGMRFRAVGRDYRGV